MAGRLVAVVGPSGAGKDTLLSAARRNLAKDARFVFARRLITRPAEAAVHDGAEDHEPVSEEAFEALRRSGGLALHWQAHGLHYGIPASVEAALSEGCVVVANLSRTVLATTPARYRLRVLQVTASPALLMERLRQRGREDADSIALRLQRQAVLPQGLDVRVINNDSTPEQGAAALVDALMDCLPR
ncbi:phosphonate metabolism protein/1,5-bisphosphokinase (PRPP-forming) PhnN [Teichococcus oryzae]|uniref:Ribose 1,5-bisphosphate phosphokinase PhnN n=1 Tax=Teichococcus oryzae TaxID=1608942 RepID=A0A5B2TBN6_9PROT|nr:phosphonate metabolism protein/1,5-bisphosphokinase (PRPP-forming) PhnN [Pseudoroseomonas oryzae]KAA2211474.1 phosphonate metabolism protein/1,5-bisphosphokinase (PRPP-forming) PhnN [Pseudoroseomonas oryzae]